MRSIFVEISIFDSKKTDVSVITPFKHYFWVENNGVKKIGKTDINKCMKNFMKTAKDFKRKLTSNNIWAIVSMDDEDYYTFLFRINIVLFNEDTKEIIESSSKEIPFRLISPLPSDFGTADSLLSVSLSECIINEMIKKYISRQKQVSVDNESDIIDNGEERSLLVNISEHYHTVLKRHADNNGTSMKDVICNLIENYFFTKQPTEQK